MRHEIPVQLDPAVAVALRRVGEDWIIVYNPGLTRQARVIAIAEAHQYADSFEMGWSYRPPAGGVDVVIEDSFLGLAAVESVAVGVS